MTHRIWLAIGSLSLTLAGCQTVPSDTSRPELAFVGTQASGSGQGIVGVRLDPSTGALTSLGIAAQVERPTWVLTDPAHRRLFSVSEVGNDGKRNGAVLAFAYDPATGALSPLGRADSGGGGPTHLGLDAKGRALYVANYGTGQVAAIAVGTGGMIAAAPMDVEAHEGAGPHRRQQGPHAHGVTLDPSGRYLLAADLGADRVFVYRVGEGKDALTPAPVPFVSLPPGSGPRHIVFSPDGRRAFLMTEMGGAIFTFGWDAASGSLTELSHVPLNGTDFAGTRSGSELAISRDGRFLYAGNRAANRIQVYAVDSDGVLDLQQSIDCGGLVPWGFSLSGSGKWLVVANQGSGNLAVFAVDKDTGRLSATANRLDLAKPTSVSFIDR
jgi:6-phosphogluconolactonase